MKVGGLIKPETLTGKTLFYTANNALQVNELHSFLTPERYAEIRTRMKENGFRSGFACLFYGAPGTGKTETVYQLARQTGRSIMTVNVPDIKSKWVGESEKNVHIIFTQYFAQILKCKGTPILLLNEADAIISRRLENSDTSVGQMYNRVQNILLQELEDFQGILIATTNLENLFDPAFERRFLFKIHFSRPDADVRARLWQSVIPDLSSDDCRVLADEYPAFAGGQIANVGRKAIIDATLHDTSITLERLRDCCLRETLAPHKNNLGFRVSA
jgi:SpoVK/Ycf46/Vps4 family AAA+-type ATPase